MKSIIYVFALTFLFGCIKKKHIAVETTSVNNIIGSEAFCEGKITSDKGNDVETFGFCWSKNHNPTISENKTIESGTPAIIPFEFSERIFDLEQNGSVYYVRAYASSGRSTFYGNEISFTTCGPLPTVTTDSVDSDLITSSATAISGKVPCDGGNPVTANGICWGTSPNPTTANSKTSDPIGETFLSSITGIQTNILYYARAYATNSAGTAYGNQVTFLRFPPIGATYGGGILGYVLQSGDPGYDPKIKHGLIVEPTFNTTVQWGCYAADITGADGTAIGTGAQNTIDIVTNCPTLGNAARESDALNEGGFTDWYLPSKDELKKLYYNRNMIGGFDIAGPSPVGYWSSSERGSNEAWTLNFKTGDELASNKTYYFRYRSVRSF